MNTKDLRALALAAKKYDWCCTNSDCSCHDDMANLQEALTPYAILALLDTIEAQQKRIDALTEALKEVLAAERFSNRPPMGDRGRKYEQRHYARH